MRFLVLLFLLLASAGAARAQMQERKLEDRLTRPDKNMTFDTRQASFGEHSVSTKTAVVKDFGGSKSFGTKEFSSTGFWGSKTAWLPKFFGTKEASTKGKHEIPNAATKYDTKTADTKDAREGSKTMETTSYAAASRGYLEKGRSQDRFDGEKSAGGMSREQLAASGYNASAVSGPGAFSKPIGYSGDMKPMTIDDVRDLLNKNK